jgi:hypothetical protein
MPTYFNAAGRLCCSRCFHDLTGHDSSGRCPSCNTWYAADRARVAPGGARLRQLSLRPGLALAAVPPHSWRWICLTILALGNAAVIGGIGWIGVRTFMRMCGMWH